MAPTNDTPQLKRIGEIVGFHGLNGFVKVKTAQENPAWAGQLKHVIYRLGSEERPYTIAAIRQKNPNHYMVRFEGIRDRTHAEQTLGRGQLYAKVSDLPALETGEVYADDLIGRMVVDSETGVTLGTVKDLLTAAAGRDYLEIAVATTGKTEVVPYTEHFFPQPDDATTVPSGVLLSAGLREFLGAVSS